MNYALLDYTNKIKNKILKSPHILETIINEMEHDDTTIKLFIGTNLVGSYNLIDIF